jgi:hypothetical protein
VHLFDYVLAVDDQRPVTRHPQRDVQHRPVLGNVDVLASEHRVAARGDAALVRELPEQGQGLVGDPVLRVVENEAGALSRQALAAVGIVGEQVAEVAFADLGVVLLERLPGRPTSEGGLRRLLAHGPAA